MYLPAFGFEQYYLPSAHEIVMALVLEAYKVGQLIR
jgi:hypothetical protein